MNQSPPLEVPKRGLAQSEIVQPTSPVSSCMSLKSDDSMDPPLKFQDESSSVPRKSKLQSRKPKKLPAFLDTSYSAHDSQIIQPTSPVSSCVSMKSDHSMNPPLKFQEESSSIPRVEPTSLVSSCMSMKSHRSMEPPLKLQEDSSDIPRVEPTSPVSSCMSMKSHRSMEPPLKLQDDSSDIPSIQTSPVSSCVSMKSDLSMNPPLKFQEKASSIPRTIHQKRSHTSAPSCTSVKSDWSMDLPDSLNKSWHRTNRTKPQPRKPRKNLFGSYSTYDSQKTFHQESSHTFVPSYTSVKSDWSMNLPDQKYSWRRNWNQTQYQQGKPRKFGHFKSMSYSAPDSQNLQPTPTLSSCVSMKKGHSIDLPSMKLQEESSIKTIRCSIRISASVQPSSALPSCVSMKSDDSMNSPPKFHEESSSSIKTVLPALTCLSINDENSMKPPPKLQNETSELLRCSEFPDKEICMKLKSILKNRFQLLPDGLLRYGHSTLLSEIYTELYITEGGSGEVNDEHEVRQIETASRLYQLEDDKPIKCNDIFKPIEGRSIRTAITKGVAGIGKTVSVQKFILDWAEDTANHYVHYIFPLPFRELNLVKDQHFSLEGLVHYFFPELKEMKFTNATSHKIVFIFDGLDEHRFPLNFQNSMIVSEVNIPTSIAVLLTNLIKGNLLPDALIWITTRPAAASQIPHEWISQVTEIRGFNDPQKEEYLRKYIRDETLANEVIKHLKLSRSLYIMCHIPVFCWISATVLEKMLTEAEGKAIPKTLTQMYTHFLIIQTCIRKKYNEPDDEREMIVKLGELAFKQLIKGNLIFYEEDLKECSINVRDAVLHSGVCTRIIKKDSELLHNKGNVYCFVHLSIQEHLAALYVHISFSSGNATVLTRWSPTKCAVSYRCPSLTDLHKSAVDKALQCKRGEFDLFLRFLLGISLESNQALLQELFPQISPCGSQSVQDAIEYIHIRLRMNLNPEKYINLFHCLNELDDFSLEEEIHNFQQSRRLAKMKLSPSQWAALVFVLLTSGNTLDVFDLGKYSIDNTDECLQRMLPVVKASRTAEVRNCNPSDKGFEALTSALSSKSSCLRELKLGGNVLHQSGIQILSAGLWSRHCKLEFLELSDCQIQGEGWKPLFLALSSNPLHLRHLDLSFNPLLKAGTVHLSNALRNPDCRLETIKLNSCQINSESCPHLALALMNNSHLIELDLSKNILNTLGAQHLSNSLRNPSCKLKILSLADCGINSDGCRLLCNALYSNPSHLSDLCLNRNPLTDKGVKFISDFLSKPFCMLEKLSLSYCSVTEPGCIALASALKLNPSHLRELELTGNQPGTSGREQLKVLQQHKDYRLEKLKL